MTGNLSGREIAANNLQKFLTWISERDAAADWQDYMRQGKLNRTELATECGFALAVLRQNPAVKSALEALESRLQSNGILQSKQTSPNASIEANTEAASQSIEKRIMAAKVKAEQRVKQLEEQNAALKAEVRDLRDQIKTYRHLDEHLCGTGRLLHA